MAGKQVEKGTVTAIELGGEAKDERDLKSGWISVGTRCKIETDDGEVIWARVLTFALATWASGFAGRRSVCTKTGMASGTCMAMLRRKLG